MLQQIHPSTVLIESKGPIDDFLEEWADVNERLELYEIKSKKKAGDSLLNGRDSAPNALKPF